jgi:hypothetical protein
MKPIRPKSGDLRSLKLSPEEGFVLSRVDAPTSVKELVALTGLDESRVVEIVGRLATEGALDIEGDIHASGPPSSARTVSAAPASSQSPLSAAPVSSQSPLSAPPESDSPLPSTPEVEAAIPSSQRMLDDDSIPEEDLPPVPESTESVEEVEDAAEVEKTQTDERNYRKIYETVYHPLTREQRITEAINAEGPNLCALCLDADPQVIHAVLSNPRVGFEHARLIAAHHKTHTGLDMLGRRTEFLADAGTQRRLLANQQLPDNILRRMVNPKLIMEVYKICINREYPERTRVKTRELLQKKFMLGSSDERAALLIKTEGRCLILMNACALDVRATQILCAKTSYTILFIQNLARWSATPPALLTHLLKQAVVRNNMGLRKMLLKHPNVPAEVKRNLTP